MKLPKSENKTKSNGKRINRHQRSREPDHVTEMLKLCLQRICELQQEISQEEEMHDPEAAGYTACALETFRFLSNQGLPADHPVVKALSDKLLRNKD